MDDDWKKDREEFREYLGKMPRYWPKLRNIWRLTDWKSYWASGKPWSEPYMERCANGMYVDAGLITSDWGRIAYRNVGKHVQPEILAVYRRKFAKCIEEDTLSDLITPCECFDCHDYFGESLQKAVRHMVNNE